MTLPVCLSLVLVLLSIMTAQCDGCNDYLKGVVESLKTTINDNRADFRQVFPVDYTILHHYNDGLFCTEPCCVFQAAAVLSDSWNQLLNNLWKENHKYSVVYDLKNALNDIKKERLQDEPQVSLLPQVSSSPEDLLARTSALFSRWLEMKLHCSSHKCLSPTEPTPAEANEGNQPPSRHRLLTTRAIRQERQWQPALNITGPLSNGGPSCLQSPGALGTLLLCGLYLLQ